MVRSKISPATILTSVDHEGAYTMDVLPQYWPHCINYFRMIPHKNELPSHADTRQTAQSIIVSSRPFKFDMELLYKCTAKIKKYKAPGPDQVYGETLKLAIPLIDDILLRIYNDGLTFGYFPKKWKHDRVVTILKSLDKDPSDIKSYRPITLLSELGKLLERMIVESMKKLHDEDLYSDCQYGFVQGKGTTDALNNVLS